jgi:hypothetical protein
VNNGCKVWRNNFDASEQRQTDICNDDENVGRSKVDLSAKHPSTKCPATKNPKSEIVSPDSTTNPVFYRVKRELEEELLHQQHLPQQQQHHHQQSQLFPSSHKTILNNNL